MANQQNRWPDNVTGIYYVDDQCIDCDACRAEAPKNFKRNESHGYSFVYSQPQTPDEEAQSLAALKACPVEAIGVSQKTDLS